MFAPKLCSRIINSAVRCQVRGIQSNDSLLDEITEVRNRNPRNLEFLTIGNKPKGYWLEKDQRSFWHRPVFKKTTRYIKLELHHFENGEIISVSTNDYSMKKQLRRPCDTAAYLALAEVFAERCLESGITTMSTIKNENANEKLSKLIEKLTSCGLILTEAEEMLTPCPWHREKLIKPWEIDV